VHTKQYVLVAALMLSIDNTALAEAKGHWCETPYDGRVFTVRDCSYYGVYQDTSEVDGPDSETIHSVSRTSPKPVSKDGFSLTRFYQSSSDHMRVTIVTDRQRRIRCYIIDKKGIPITSFSQRCWPPLDEIAFRVDPSKAHTARCEEE
jgi:hypothetical protein